MTMTAADVRYETAQAELVERTHEMIHAIADTWDAHSDRGTPRPGIRGTVKKLNSDVLDLLAASRVLNHPHAVTGRRVARMIERAVRDAYKAWEER